LSTSNDFSELMRLSQGGNEDAYRLLLSRASIWLRGVARHGLLRAGLNTEDGEDIVQDTLLAMHLKRDTWDESQPLEPWLRAIARHKMVDHLRRRGFRKFVDIDDYMDTLVVPQNVDENASIDTQRILACLSDHQRQIVEAISIEGFAARDVGQRLGMSEGAVRVALHRALKILATVYRRERS
jgi:RNA polymerase sigma-70 factor (ECF subfamily)